MKEKDILIYCGEDEWNHDLSDQKYVPLQKVNDIENLIKQSKFLKLSRKIKLKNCSALIKEGKKTYELFLSTTN